MKRPKLVVLDLDGTTLNPQHDLNPATIEAIRAVRKRGVRVMLASGRLPHSILPFARTLGLDGVHLGLNGGVAFDMEGRLKHKHVLSIDQLRFAQNVLDEEGLESMVFGAGGIWAAHLTPEVEYVVSYGEPAVRLYDPHHLELITDPIKVLAVLDAGPRDNVIAQRVAPGLQAIRTGPKFFEFMPPGVTKGASLRELMHDLGLKKADVMAVGDSENDASLLAEAGFAVAMGNAVEAIRRQADTVTGTNAEDGVAQALHRWVLEK